MQLLAIQVKQYNLVKENSGDRLPQIGDVMYKDYAKSHEINMYSELMDAIRTQQLKDFPEQKYKNKYLSIPSLLFLKGQSLRHRILHNVNLLKIHLGSLKEKNP